MYGFNLLYNVEKLNEKSDTFLIDLHEPCLDISRLYTVKKVEKFASLLLNQMDSISLWNFFQLGNVACTTHQITNISCQFSLQCDRLD
jgi:hypothetical protein